MSMLDGLLHRIHVLWRGERYARELEAEMHFHQELDVSNGARSPRRFGNATYYREETRAFTPLRVLDRVRQDTAYATRALRRAPGFSFAVVLILALGFGVNTAMFSLFDTLYLRAPDAVTAPDELRRLYIQVHRPGDAIGTYTYDSFNYASFRAVSEANTNIPIAAATPSDSVGITAGGAHVFVRGSEVSGTYFDVLGLRPRLGRFFAPEERTIESPTFVAVISERLWRRVYHEAPNAVGQKMLIDRRPFTIIGVAPPDFRGIDLDAVDVWVPLNTHVGAYIGIPGPWYEGFNNSMYVVARLEPGGGDRALLGRATNAFRGVRLKYFEYDPKANVLDGPIMRAAGPMKQTDAMLVARRVTWMAAIVLLIACANVVNLMLLRVSRRGREIAVRRALGVSRGRLIAQVGVESVIISVFAGAVACAVAYWTGRVLRNLTLPDMHISAPVLDARTVAFAIGLSLIVGILAGVAPAMNALRSDVIDALRAGSRDVAYRGSFIRQGLVIVQTALCVVLLAAAGLFLRSLDNVSSIHFGYDGDRLVLVQPQFAEGRLAHTDDLRRAVPMIVDRLRHLRAVEDVATSVNGPMNGVRYAEIFLPGRDSMPKASKYPPSNVVSPTFFRATGLRIIRGRAFTDADNASAARVVVVTRAMEQAFWPGESAIGKCLIIGKRTNACNTVVGVAEDAHAMRLIEAPQLLYFLPLAQDQSPASVIDVRLRGAPDAALALVRTEVERAVRELLPSAEGATVQRVADSFERELRPWVLGARIFTGFAILSLVVAAFGIYSVVAYAVSQRTNEMGIRVALGAATSHIMDLVVGEGIRAVIAGLIVGAFAALIAGRFLRTFLFGVTSQDPSVFAAAIAVLLALGTLACAIPGWRASRIEPASALRVD